MITDRAVIITYIDLDTNDIEVLQQKLEAIHERCPFVLELWYRVSSRKGYHIKIKHYRPITVLQHFEIRATFGDDETRIRLDLERLFNDIDRFNLLWDSKDVLKNSEQSTHTVGPWLKYEPIPDPITQQKKAHSIIREIYKLKPNGDEYGR